MQERDVRNKNFVFIGGSHGMGKATALALAKRGASILIVSRGQEAGQQTVSEALSLGASEAKFISADLSSMEGIVLAGEKIRAWKPELSGLTHSAMSAFNKRIITSDNLDFAFVLQYQARAMLNRMLVDNLAASGDGRIIHFSGNVSKKMANIDLDDLQFNKRKWTFFKSILGTHYLGFLHLYEASKRWQDLPISTVATCVESVKTKAMTDPNMPLIMRILGFFGTTPELASRNAVHLLTAKDRSQLKSAIVRHSKKYEIEHLEMDSVESEKLWDITTAIAKKCGIDLEQ